MMNEHARETSVRREAKDIVDVLSKGVKKKENMRVMTVSY